MSSLYIVYIWPSLNMLDLISLLSMKYRLHNVTFAYENVAWQSIRIMRSRKRFVFY